ncbi:MAG: hypothetical protein HC923_10070, partial [Myxococcales bacterium]|nr:hypothetical protein [Myxococcales bacterium]
AIAAGDATTALTWLLEVRRLGLGQAPTEALDQEIRTLLREQLDARGVRALLEELSPREFPFGELLYRLAAIQVHIGDLANGRQSFERYLREFPDGPFAEDAQAMLARLEARQQVRPRRLGVLLPLSGRHRSYGELALQAIRLALPTSTGIELVVRDTESDAVTAGSAPRGWCSRTK